MMMKKKRKKKKTRKAYCLCGMTQCVADTYKQFRKNVVRPHSHLQPEYEGDRCFRNVRTYEPNYASSHTTT
jgi:hypothetical protein